MFSFVLRVSRLPVFDLNYVFCSEKQDLQEYYNLRLVARVPYVSCFIAYLKILGKGVFLLFKRREERAFPKGGIVLFTHSGNNTACLEPIRKMYPDACWVGPPAYAPSGPSISATAWVSLLFLPAFIWRWIRGTAYEKRSMAYAMDTTLLAYGYYVLSCLWLKKYAPRLVVFANDHSTFPRIFRAAALDQKFKTLYLQHASVTSTFPPLDFDYACLDGQDSLDKYREAGDIKSTIFLTGMAKSAQLKDRINNHEKVNSVGVCVNILDDLDQIKSLILGVREFSPDLPLVWRPHPAMASMFESMQAWGDLNHIKFSNPKEESIWDFMDGIDLLLAGNSSVHVEATLLNITSVYIDSGGGREDVYGYVRAGLVDQYEGALFDKIAEFRECRPNVRHKAEYYCADIGTTYEGRADFLLAYALKMILEDSVPRDVFEKVKSHDEIIYIPRRK